MDTDPIHLPTAIDPGELMEACRAVSALSHPDSRPIGDIAMQTLRVAIAKRSIGASTVKGLRQSVRKQVREAWTDGIVVPLARSREPSDREVLQAVPMTLNLKAIPTVRSVLERLAGEIPKQAVPTRERVAVALGYLSSLPVILEALDMLDGLVTDIKPHPAPHLVTDGVDRAEANAMALARRRLRGVFTKGLAALVDDVAHAAYRRRLGAMDEPAFRATAAVLATLPAHGARRFDRGATQWRRRLHEALLRDVVDDRLCPAVERLLRRHPGLTTADATYRPCDDHGGEIGIVANRGAVTLSLAVRFALGSGRMDLAYMAAAGDAGARQVEEEEADALLDSFPPPAFDTGVHRALRRLHGTGVRPSLRMSASEDGNLVVVARGPEAASPEFVEALAAIADEEGVTVLFAAPRDNGLASALLDNGFVCPVDQPHGYLSRDPCTPGTSCRR